MKNLIRRVLHALGNHPYPTPSTCGICGGPIPCLKH